MEHVRFTQSASEREAQEVQQKAKELKGFSEATIDASDYQKAHDQLTEEHLEEMREYIEITGDEKYREAILEFLARNYRASEFQKIGLSSIALLDEIKYYNTNGDGTESKTYTKAEYLEAKTKDELPKGDNWLRTRASARWQEDDPNYGTIQVYSPFDYPYEMPKHVEEAKDKEIALLEYLLGHEVTHYIFAKMFVKQETMEYKLEELVKTEFGKLMFVEKDNQTVMHYQNLDAFMSNPFTPYLKVRVKTLEPLYQKCITDKEVSEEFIHEFSEYYQEFLAEAGGLAKSKDVEEMDDLERYFVSLYDEVESKLGEKGI